MFKFEEISESLYLNLKNKQNTGEGTWLKTKPQ